MVDKKKALDALNKLNNYSGLPKDHRWVSTVRHYIKEAGRTVRVNPPRATGKAYADIATIVQSDIEQRACVGERKYGVRLQPFNNRDALTDAYQEALDLCMYLRQAIYERDNKEENCHIVQQAKPKSREEP